MATIWDEARDRREREAGLQAKPAKAPELPPYGSMTLGGSTKPEDPELTAAKNAAKLRLLRATGRTP